MHLDTVTEIFFVGIRTPSLTSFFLYTTALGNAVTVGCITLFIVLLCLLFRKRILALSFLLTVGGTVGTVGILKILIARARPDTALALVTETSPSFPSAHSALSVALYGLGAYVLWRHFPQRIVKLLIALFSVLLISAVTVSRLYLGVHYLTDVLGGLLVGLLWLSIGIYLSRRYA